MDDSTASSCTASSSGPTATIRAWGVLGAGRGSRGFAAGLGSGFASAAVLLHPVVGADPYVEVRLGPARDDEVPDLVLGQEQLVAVAGIAEPGLGQAHAPRSRLLRTTKRLTSWFCDQPASRCSARSASPNLGDGAGLLGHGRRGGRERLGLRDPPVAARASGPPWGPGPPAAQRSPRPRRMDGLRGRRAHRNRDPREDVPADCAMAADTARWVITTAPSAAVMSAMSLGGGSQPSWAHPRPGSASAWAPAAAIVTPIRATGETSPARLPADLGPRPAGVCCRERWRR